MPARATAKNAVTRVITEYVVGTDVGAQTALAFGRWDARARKGLLSQATVGLDDPSTTWLGVIGRPLQQFTGAAALAANRHQYRDGSNELSDNLSGEGMADPARRIFAERLRRRQ